MKVALQSSFAVFLTLFATPFTLAYAEEIPSSIPASVTEIQNTISSFGPSEVRCPLQNSESEEPLICTDPVKAVCESGSSTLLEREKKIKALQKQVYEKSMAALTKTLGKDPGTLTSMELASPKYENLSLLKFQEIERQTFEALKEFGWSKEKVSQLIEKVKAAETAKIHPNDGVDSSKLKLFSEAPWITGESLERFPKEKRDRILSNWNFLCGSDGMALQAFSSRVAPPERILNNQLTDADPAVFTVCPGLLLEAAADSDGPEKLSFVMGHELGHIIQPDEPIVGTLKVYSDSDKKKIAEAERFYQKAASEAEAVCPKLKGCFVRKAIFSDESFINSCDVDKVMKECDGDPELLKNKATAISSAGRIRQQVIDQLTAPEGDTNRDRAMLSCLKTYDLSEMNNGTKQEKAFERVLESELRNEPDSDKRERYRYLGISKIKKSISDFESEFGREPDAVDLHQDELIADYWGTVALAASLKEVSNEQLRRRIAIGNLEVHCHNEAKTKSLDFEQHPADAYRLRRALDNPEIRASLGCKTAPVKPWCDR